MSEHSGDGLAFLTDYSVYPDTVTVMVKTNDVIDRDKPLKDHDVLL